MDVARDHIVHSRGGRLDKGAATKTADIARLLKAAADSQLSNGLAVHFHGGLVSEASGREIAGRLAPLYFAAGAYPLCFVWESGLVETLRNNLRDILRDSVFQELVKKAGEWALKELGGTITTRGAGAAVNARELRKDFDAWFAGEAAAPPITLDTPERPGVRHRAVEPDEDDLAARIEAELDNDERFQEVMAGLYLASGKGTQAQTRGGAPAAADVDSPIDQAALDQMFPPTTAGATKGLFTWYKIAKFVAKIVVAVVRRHRSDRDHGGYTTIVEEVLRSAYVDKLGELVWRTIKKDTGDAFGPDPASVGTALLGGLATLAASGKHFPRISLIGHSTGAIYINHFIEHAATALPGTSFDVVFLAPANRFEEFHTIVEKRPGSIRNFRMFAMTDENEALDQLVSVAYPRSLLYLVSGILEGEADVPIMGMKRFLDREEIFGAAEFPAVAGVRQWLAESPHRTVWSIDARTSGFGSGARKHGDFDNDEPTLASLKHILEKGY